MLPKNTVDIVIPEPWNFHCSRKLLNASYCKNILIASTVIQVSLSHLQLYIPNVVGGKIQKECVGKDIWRQSDTLISSPFLLSLRHYLNINLPILSTSWGPYKGHNLRIIQWEECKCRTPKIDRTQLAATNLHGISILTLKVFLNHVIHAVSLTFSL